MTTLSAHTTRAIHNKGRAAIYSLAAEFDVDYDDVIALLGTTSHTSVSGRHSPFKRLESTTPSQPLQTSSQAPAADTSTMPPVDEATDGAAESSSLPTEPSVAPIAPSPLAGDPAGEAGSPPNPVASSSAAFSPARGRPVTTRAKIVAVHAEHPEWPSKLIAEALNISEDAVRATASRKGLKLVSWWDHQRAVANLKIAALRQSVHQVAAPTPQPEPEQPPATIPEPAIAAPAPAKPVSLGKRIAAHVAEHPDATLKDVTEALGAKMQAVGWAAQKAGIVLRKYTAEERSEATSKGIQARKATPPSEPARSLMPRADAIQPDETVMGHTFVSGHRVASASASARFYLRDAKGRYLHQSLQRSPTEEGPLMTVNRAYGWFDNAQRYRGALKLWPEIATLRKEGVAK